MKIYVSLMVGLSFAGFVFGMENEKASPPSYTGPTTSVAKEDLNSLFKNIDELRRRSNQEIPTIIALLQLEEAKKQTQLLEAQAELLKKQTALLERLVENSQQQRSVMSPTDIFVTPKGHK